MMRSVMEMAEIKNKKSRMNRSDSLDLESANVKAKGGNIIKVSLFLSHLMKYQIVTLKRKKKPLICIFVS